MSQKTLIIKQEQLSYCLIRMLAGSKFFQIKLMVQLIKYIKFEKPEMEQLQINNWNCLYTDNSISTVSYKLYRNWKLEYDFIISWNILKYVISFLNFQRLRTLHILSSCYVDAQCISKFEYCIKFFPFLSSPPPHISSYLKWVIFSQNVLFFFG